MVPTPTLAFSLSDPCGVWAWLATSKAFACLITSELAKEQTRGLVRGWREGGKSRKGGESIMNIYETANGIKLVKGHKIFTQETTHRLVTGRIGTLACLFSPTVASS